MIRIFPNPVLPSVQGQKHQKSAVISGNNTYDRVFQAKLDKFEDLYREAKQNTLMELNQKDAQDDGGPVMMPGNDLVSKTSRGMLDTLNSHSRSEGFKFDPSLLNFAFDHLLKRYLDGSRSSISQHRAMKKYGSTQLLQSSVSNASQDSSSAVYEFDFSKYRLDNTAIKELQSSFDVHSIDIKRLVEHFLKEFPFMRIPLANIDVLEREKKINEYLYIYGEDKKRFNEKKYLEIQHQHQYSKSKFDLIDIELVRGILDKEEIVKIIGILLHIANWIIFRSMMVVPIDPTRRKQMFVLIMHHYHKIEEEVIQSVKKRLPGAEHKLWAQLVCPILIVAFKMVAEYFFLKKLPVFLKDTRAREETIRLLFSIIGEIFDPSGLNSSLLFWQTSVRSN